MQKPEQYKIIDNCNDLILDLFIKILETGDYSHLIIDGSPPVEVLQNTWMNIWDEYCVLSEQTEYKKAIYIFKEYGTLKGKLLAITLCLDVLKHGYNQKCVELLNEYGYKYKFDNLETFAADWLNVDSISKSVFINFKSAEKKYLDFVNKAEKKEVKKADWAKTLAQLSKYQGYNVSRKSITVAEYCGIIRGINESNKK